MPEVVLKLFLSGESPEHQTALCCVQALCSRYLAGNYQLEVIDVREHPHLAEAERVFATPTLCRVSPEPAQRVVGELESPEQLIAALRLSELSCCHVQQPIDRCVTNKIEKRVSHMF